MTEPKQAVLAVDAVHDTRVPLRIRLETGHGVRTARNCLADSSR